MHTVDKQLSSSTLAFMIIAIIISPIGMVVMAQYGIHALFYYGLVIAFFFIPSGIIFAELGSALPDGGLYQWTKAAFGALWGSIAVWFRWLSALITFPVIITFVSSMATYVFLPQYSHNAYFTFWVCVAVISVSTLLAYFGIRGTTLVSIAAATCASIIPSVILICGALYLLMTHQVHWRHVAHFAHPLPNFSHLASFSLLGATVLMFSGMELAAYCLKYAKDPRHQYSRAMLMAIIVICTLAVLGTIAMALLVPANLSVISGMMQAFAVLFVHLHHHNLVYVITITMMFGWVCVLATLMTTLSFGLEALGRDHLLPASFGKENRFGAPTLVVNVQGLVVLLLSTLYIVLPGVSAAYWTIEAIAAVTTGLLYVILFSAAIRLRYSHKELARPICVPGGNIGMWLFAGVAIIMCLFATVMTFVPPDQFSIGKTMIFQLTLIGGVLACLIAPTIISRICHHGYAD